MGFDPVNAAFLEFRVCARLREIAAFTTNRHPDS
jgi:hypothetical protein